VLYELAAGAHPFDRRSVFETLEAINHETPPPPSSRNPFVPENLDALVLRMLAKDPAERPPAAEIARILERRSWYQMPARANTNPIPAPSVAGSHASSHGHNYAIPRWVAGIASLALAAVVFWWVGSGGQEIAFEPLPLTTLPGSEEGPSFSPDGRQVAYRGDQNKQWDIYVKLIGGGPPLRLTSDAGTHWYPAWSADGKWVAFTARHEQGRNGLFPMPALGGPERLLAEFDGEWRTQTGLPMGNGSRSVRA
jgi:serine/threonine protein kinase